MGFLGFVALDGTLTRHLQLANGNAPATADSAPTFRIYGTDGTPVAALRSVGSSTTSAPSARLTGVV